MEKIKIFLVNRGRYSKGDAVRMGEWVKLPIHTDPDKMEQMLERLGINAECWEYIISDFNGTMPNLEIRGDTSISELNTLAEEIEMLNEWSYMTMCSAVEMECPSTIKEMRLLLSKLSHYYLIPEICDESSLAEFFVECENAFANMPDDHIARRFFDFARYGRYIHARNLGTFTSYGYLMRR